MTALGAIYPGLKARVIFITGGATGIGAELVRAFVGQGAVVSFCDIQDEAGRALAVELGAPARYVHVDVTDVAALQSAASALPASS